jgi:hypothetical protein
MALRTLAAAMLAGSIPASKLDLTDDYAFTGAVTVDGAGVATGADFGLQRVAVATKVNIPNFAAAGNSIDGYSLQADDKVLVRAQTDPAENGIYKVTTVGTGSNGVWERHEDADDPGELPIGLLVVVSNGSSLGGSLHTLQEFGGTVDTDSMIFARFDEGLTPYAQENLVNVGTGDGSTVLFDLPQAKTAQLLLFVGLLPQLGDSFTINAGAGTGGVDQLELTEAPAAGVPIDVTGWYKA